MPHRVTWYLLAAQAGAALVYLASDIVRRVALSPDSRFGQCSLLTLVVLACFWLAWRLGGNPETTLGAARGVLLGLPFGLFAAIGDRWPPPMTMFGLVGLALIGALAFRERV